MFHLWGWVNAEPPFLANILAPSMTLIDIPLKMTDFESQLPVSRVTISDISANENSTGSPKPCLSRH